MVEVAERGIYQEEFPRGFPECHGLIGTSATLTIFTP